MRSLLRALMLVTVVVLALTTQATARIEAAAPTTVRVSTSTAGLPADMDVIDPAISGTGRYVIFRSHATTLVPGGQPGALDIFLRDRDTNDDGGFDGPDVSTIRASVDDSGLAVEGEHNWAPDITPDGRFLAFASDQFDLASTSERCSWKVDANGNPIDSSCPNVFVRDRDADGDGVFDESDSGSGPPETKNTRVSVSNVGVQSNGGSHESAISADGRHVAFLSVASNLVPVMPGDTPGTIDVFVRDRNIDDDLTFDEPGEVRTTRMSESSSGIGGDKSSTSVAISANGRFVAFTSAASNLVDLDMNFFCDVNGDQIYVDNCPDVFVRDRDADPGGPDGVFDEPGQVATIRASISTDGVEGDHESGAPVLSSDGRYVVFESRASNLVTGDTNENCMFNGGGLPQNCDDIFVRDLLANTTVRVSVSGDGDQGDGGSLRPTVSADGRFVSFHSGASSLVGADTNGADDIFLRDRDTDRDGTFDENGFVSTTILSVPSVGGQANGLSANAAITPNGCKSSFQSEGWNLVQSDTNGVRDIFVRQLADGDDDATCDIVDNCETVPNANQANFDEDLLGDACDADIDGDGIANASDPEADGDGVMNTDEANCGGNSLDSMIRPERLDGLFDDSSDDGDATVDEVLPAGSEGFDCDGDGWTGAKEGQIFNNGPATVSDQDPCGATGWPADLDPNNKLNIGDVGSFLSPSRAFDGHVGPSAAASYNKFNHTLDDTAPFDGASGIESAMARWNLATPPHTGTTVINIGDLNSVLSGAGASPPMFGGQRAFFTDADGPGPLAVGECPWPAEDPPPPPMNGMAGPMSGESTSEAAGSEEHIDQVSIDTGPLGSARAPVGNGKPAIGDRNGDTLPDAEGYDTPDPGDAAGACGNGLDDDRGDANGDTVPDGPLDGVADDGCQAPLTPRESCINLIDDGVKNADEDTVDRAMIDITVGSAPALTGVPSSRLMSAWQYSLGWDVDVLDVRLQMNSFLILSNGGASPFVSVANAVPDPTTPFTAGVADPGPGESGPGVLSRVTIEGNAAGVANLALSGVTMRDAQNSDIPVDAVYGAKIAVSKDLDGDGVIEAMGANGQEAFSCPPT